MDIVINVEDSIYLNSSWNLSYLNNSTKMFLFRLANNNLGYNYMLTHFVPGHSPLCTFCEIARDGEAPRETPGHLFHDCPYINPLITMAIAWLVPDIRDREKITRKGLIGKPALDCEYKNEILFLLFKLCLKYIYDCKLKKYLPNFENCKEILIDEVKTMLRCSRKFRMKFENSNIRILQIL